MAKKQLKNAAVISPSLGKKTPLSNQYLANEGGINQFSAVTFIPDIAKIAADMEANRQAAARTHLKNAVEVGRGFIGLPRPAIDADIRITRPAPQTEDILPLGDVERDINKEPIQPHPLTIMPSGAWDDRGLSILGTMPASSKYL